MPFIRSKHIFYTFIVFLSFFLTNCQKNKVIKSHGIFYLENRDRLLKVNTTNTNDVIKILGQPHTKSIKDKNTWLYIERTRTRGKMIKFGRNILLNNNVLVVKFDNYGILKEKILYNKNDMNEYKFAEAITVNEVKRGSFIDSFLSSIREKMYAGRK
tara:strand:+ start:111 stop:581 length:471 start_codon:yes stop_codon:yes gene_type:complete